MGWQLVLDPRQAMDSKRSSGGGCVWFRPPLFKALDVSLRVLSALCLAFGLYHFAFVPGIDVTFRGSMFTWPMDELRGTSEADA